MAKQKEIKFQDLQAAYDAEDAAKEQAAIREVTERAKKFHARLDAMGLKYRDLLELEVLAHSLGDMGHNILLVWNVLLVFELVLQARPEIHGNRADLHLDFHVFFKICKIHRNPDNQVQAAVPVRLRVNNVILARHQRHIIL